jgi:hypothetical protein
MAPRYRDYYKIGQGPDTYEITLVVPSQAVMLLSNFIYF